MRAALGRVITKLQLVEGVEMNDYLSEYKCWAKNTHGNSSAITMKMSQKINQCNHLSNQKY